MELDPPGTENLLQRSGAFAVDVLETSDGGHGWFLLESPPILRVRLPKIMTEE